MFFYIYLFSAVSILVFIADLLKPLRLTIILIVIIILSLALGLRGPSVGTDTLVYYSHLDQWINGASNTLEGEPGLYLIYKAYSLLSIPAGGYYLFIGFLTTIFFVLGVKNFVGEGGLFYPVLIYMLTFYVYSYSGVRQVLAISVVFYALSVFDRFGKNKILATLTLIFLSLFIHVSIILVFPVLFLVLTVSRLRKDVANLIALIIIFSVFSSTLFIFIYFQYGSYFNNIVFSSGGGLFLYVRIFLFVSALLVMKCYKISVQDFGLLVFCFYLTGMILQIPGYFIENLYRGAYPFIIFEGIFYYRIMRLSRSYLSLLIAGLVLLAEFFLFGMELIFNGRGIVPYTSWLSTNL